MLGHLRKRAAGRDLANVRQTSPVRPSSFYICSLYRGIIEVHALTRCVRIIRACVHYNNTRILQYNRIRSASLQRIIIMSHLRLLEIDLISWLPKCTIPPAQALVQCVRITV